MALTGSAKAHAWLSAICAVCAFALLICGIVASSATPPMGAGTTQAEVDNVKSFTGTVGMGGAVPGVASLLFALLGVLGACKNMNGLITTQLVFNILLIIAHLVASLIPLFGATVVSIYCEAADSVCGGASGCNTTTSGFCSSFLGAVWAAVIFGLLCAIFNLACSVTGCTIACCNKGNTQAPAAGVPVAQPVN